MFSEIPLGDILTAGSVLFAAITLLGNIRVQGADFLLKLTERYFKDESVRDFYYKVDWQKYKFDPATLALSQEERLLDKLLYSFDEIGETFRLGVLDEKQARIFAFQAARVLDNQDVKKYLAMLDAAYEAQGLRESHPGARYLAKKLKKRRSRFLVH